MDNRNTASYAPAPKSFPRREGRVVNAMSVDVEEHFQVQALASAVSRQSWTSRASRVDYATNRVLELFAAHGVKATFFTLGWVAERHAALVQRIVQEGHEIASHGYAHVRVNTQTPEEFREDVRRTKQILEDASGSPVRGYRAATFSIDRNSFWAFPILAEEGYTYSSSVSPIAHDLYGIPDAPRTPFFPAGTSGVEEYPIATLRVGGRNWPCGGGGFFRLLPYVLSRACIAALNARDEIPAMFYFHPWEIDADQPREANLPLRSRLRHYTNLGVMAERLARVLQEFAWDRVDRVYRPGAGAVQ